jgi:arylsulfatase A-like enzyme
VDDGALSPAGPRRGWRPVSSARLPLTRIAATLLAMLAPVALIAACSPNGEANPSSGRPRHLVVVAIDALRLDHTGVGGYPAPTTPQLDRLAAGALVFTEARAASSYTLQSVAALFTGRLPSSGGSIGLLEAQPSESAITLAAALRRAGYRTALATNQPLLRGRGFTRGFDDVAVASAEEPWPCAEVVKRGLAAFDAAGDAPRFLYTQFVEPHEPHGERPDRSDLVARYDAEVTAADACLGALADGLDQRGVLDTATVVVAGTHGEELGEHGDVGSGWTLYDEVLRVPLVVRAPGRIDAGRVAAPASIADLYPTLLELHGIPLDDAARLDGRSLVAPRGGQWRPAQAVDRAVVAELVIPERAILRAVIEPGLKYVAVQKGHPPAERAAVAAAYYDLVAAVAEGTAEPPPLWGPPVIEELYDLAADPGETTNLAAAAAAPDGGTGERLARLREVLARYQQRCREHGLAARAARPRAELPSAEEIENLKSLSYL